MIIGIGSDLVDIRRIEKSIDRFGEKFTARCFTDEEQARSNGRKDCAASYAKRFAAKEAMATGIAEGVFWKEMGVVNLPNGKPGLELTGGAAKCLERLLPPGHVAQIHLTITDEFPYAQAFVIVEALPESR
jgi:holo-[acyl-carrier protein] synthase